MRYLILRSQLDYFKWMVGCIIWSEYLTQVLLQDFGVGNDSLFFRIYGCYCFVSMYLFNDITGLVMNNWDKVEKRKRQATEQDIFFEYLKTDCFVTMGLVDLYFLFIHKG